VWLQAAADVPVVESKEMAVIREWKLRTFHQHAAAIIHE
jgi:hypothetical protein